jgi:hypothetical protein
MRQGAGWTVHCRRSRCPARPVSSPSTVRSSGSLVRTRLSGRLVSSPSGVRPAGVRPAGVYPSALSHPSRPASASGSDGGTPGTAGQRSRLDPVAFHVVRPRPRRLGRWPDEALLRGSCGGRRGSVGRRTWAGWCFGGRLRPTGQAGQTAARGARRSATALGQGWLTRCCRMARCGAAIWPGAATTLRGRCGASCLSGRPWRTRRARRLGWRAAPARPSEVAGTPARRRQRRDLREWWWARQGLNL